jgi:hypothetical protein
MTKTLMLVCVVSLFAATAEAQPRSGPGKSGSSGSSSKSIDRPASRPSNPARKRSVPEPATVALLGAAATAAVVARRLRARR